MAEWLVPKFRDSGLKFFINIWLVKRGRRETASLLTQIS